MIWASIFFPTNNYNNRSYFKCLLLLNDNSQNGCYNIIKIMYYYNNYCTDMSILIFFYNCLILKIIFRLMINKQRVHIRCTTSNMSSHSVGHIVITITLSYVKLKLFFMWCSAGNVNKKYALREKHCGVWIASFLTEREF